MLLAFSLLGVRFNATDIVIGGSLKTQNDETRIFHAGDLVPGPSLQSRSQQKVASARKTPNPRMRRGLHSL